MTGRAAGGARQGARAEATLRALPGTVLALGLLHLVLVLPSQPQDLRAASLLRLPDELPAVALALALARGVGMRALVSAAALAVLVLKLADLATVQAFGRPFDPVLDLHLLASGWALLRASVGPAQALAALALASAGLALVAALLWAALTGMARLPGPGRAGLAAAAGIALAGGLALRPPPAVTADLAPWLHDRATRMARTVADLRAFDALLAEDDVGAPSFAALEGRDVIVIFVESYGRSFVEGPRFAEAARSRLREIEARLAEAGWHARSAWATSPIRGGQSWLAHATALSGLWVDGQPRHDRLMASERRSLNRLFGAAGWRTGAAMPAITPDWPEAAWFGHDVTLDADALGYRGEPFEWVTMPDQHTLAATDRMLRGGPPVMIEAALIASHAPWTPLPPILAWEEVGDGSAFDGTRRDGAAPREVWSDPERIRDQHARALDYSLDVIGRYVARHGDGALLVVLGDHQPAQLLTGPGASADAPVHVIADDPALLERLPEALFGPGMVPGADRPGLRMDGLRASWRAPSRRAPERGPCQRLPHGHHAGRSSPGRIGP